MHLPLFIAGRYLFAKKSHNVINIISAISAIGMAIGTAALIIILSVYNGFDSIVKSSQSNIEPDILIKPAEGKVFLPEGETFDRLCDNPAVASVSRTLEENVYLSYSGQNGVARAKGVDSTYESVSPLAGKMTEGKFALHHGSVPMAVAGSGLAYRMGMNPRFLPPIEIYFPSRTRRFSASNPASSLEKEKVWPNGIFSVSADIDNDLILVPIETMRSLLGYDDEVSAIEVRMVPGTSQKDTDRLIKELSTDLGGGFRVLDRYRQNESLYKMMRYEKAAVFLILIFVVIIIAFNIFSSLSMLIIEKQEDIGTLRSMGADDRLIHRIFVLEGWLISLAGLAAGLILGLAAVFIQQRYGIIKMPGSFLIEAYPVILKPLDVILSVAGVALIGYLIALIPAGKARATELT